MMFALRVSGCEELLLLSVSQNILLQKNDVKICELSGKSFQPVLGSVLTYDT